MFMPQIISGNAIASKIYEELEGRIERIKKEKAGTPGLAVILIGDNPASRVYVSMKTKKCNQLGVLSEEFTLPKDVSEKNVLQLIAELNNRKDIDGILVQLPLPEHLNENKILTAVCPSKDVDGFHPLNAGKLLIGQPAFIPCTPLGVWVMLIESGFSPEGKHVVIVGRSTIVGKPLMSILCQKKKFANATVTLCHSRTNNLPEIARSADILIAAIGRPKFITRDMVKQDAVVIDVGINRVDNPSLPRGYELVGDVDYDDVLPVVSAITPVPGGVGPMTIAMLMRNTVQSCEEKAGIILHNLY